MSDRYTRFNGAATFRPRKAGPCCTPHCAFSCFNGAATFRPRKAGVDAGNRGGRELQWGRDLSAAEGRYAAIPSPCRQTASMGPRPFGRGRCCRGSLPRRCSAASMGPRPFGRGRLRMPPCQEPAVGLQWGRDLSAAEGVWFARGAPGEGAASMGPRPFGRGRQVVRGDGARAHCASMGPRPFGRGRAVNTIVISPRGGSFNGAATFRPRKVPTAPCISRRPRGFNGAATFRPRKVARGMICLYRMGGLQWGRDLSAAEGRVRDAGKCTTSSSFNGAATFRPRKAVRRSILSAGRLASMGPRPFGRGRALLRAVRVLVQLASMGPRPFGRGRWWILRLPQT